MQPWPVRLIAPRFSGSQEQRVHTLGNGRPLGNGDYKDASRPLRRLLKQYGDGSLEAGLRYVAGNQAAQSETIALLSVDKPVSALKRCHQPQSKLIP